MNKTILFLEGRCLFRLRQEGNKIIFFSDGFDVLDALQFLPNSNIITIDKLFFEFGMGDSYNCISEKEIGVFLNLKDLKEEILKYQVDVHIYDLKITTTDFEIDIHDGRNFTISVSKPYKEYLESIILNLISKSFFYTEKLSKNILDGLNYYIENYVEINTVGEIINTYANFQMYLDNRKR